MQMSDVMPVRLAGCVSYQAAMAMIMYKVLSNTPSSLNGVSKARTQYVRILTSVTSRPG